MTAAKSTAAKPGTPTPRTKKAAPASAPKSRAKVVDDLHVVVTLGLMKETPGTYVFGEANKEKARELAVSQVYVRKAAFGNGKPPKSVTITVEAVK